MEAPRILLIEDDPDLLDLLAAAFRTAGLAVEVATGGDMGLARFRAAAADLVVTDLFMAGGEGIETIVSLRKLAPRVKIIAISGGFRGGPAPFLDLARSVGADATLAKPFRMTDLVTLAGSMIGEPANPPDSREGNARLRHELNNLFAKVVAACDLALHETKEPGARDVFTTIVGLALEGSRLIEAL